LETLLFLGANPNVDDIYGQKAIVLATDENIKELLHIKMMKAKPIEAMYSIERSRLKESTGLVLVPGVV
jgi:hypothetical protein